MKKFLTILSVIALACACTNNEESDPVVCPVAGDQQLTITASTEADTRIESTDGLQFTFKVGDKIGMYLFSDTAGKKVISTASNLCFVVKSIDDSGKATFEQDENTKISATDLAAAKQVYAYYPYNAETAVKGTYLTAAVPEEQIQAGKDDFTHLFDIYTMVTKLTSLTKDDDGNASVDLKFSGAFSLVRFNVTNNTANSISLKSVSMLTSGGLLHGNFKIDMTTDPSFSLITDKDASSLRYTDKLYICKDADFGTVVNYRIIVSFADAVSLGAGEKVVMYGLSYANNDNTGTNGVFPFYSPKFTVTDNNGAEYVITKDTKYVLPRNKRTTFNLALNDDNKIVASIDGKGYTSLNEAIAATGGKSATINLLAGNTFTLPSDVKYLTFVGEDNVKIDISDPDNKPSNYKSVTFKNITFEAGQNNYTGFAQAGKLTFEECTINGTLFGYGSDENYTNCVFNQTDPELYNMWAYTANVTYTGCTFNGNGRFLHVYHEGNNGSTTRLKVNLNNCKFVNASATASKAAVNIKTICAENGNKLHFDVNMSNCTLEGSFPTINNGLWQTDKSYDGTQDVNVKVDGTEAYKVGELTVNNADAVANVLSATGCTAVVKSDITEYIDFKPGVGKPNGTKAAPINTTLIVEEGATIKHSNSNKPTTISPWTFTTLNIKGDGKLEAFPIAGKDTRVIDTDASTTTINIDGNLTIEGGSGSKTNNCVYVHVGTVNIYNGNFHTGLDADGKANACILVDAAPSGQAYLNIYGGYFENEAEADGTVFPVINIQDDAVANSHVVIYGGTFVGFNPADGDNSGKSGSFVATGYQSVKQNEQINGKNVWVVSKK